MAALDLGVDFARLPQGDAVVAIEALAQGRHRGGGRRRAGLRVGHALQRFGEPLRVTPDDVALAHESAPGELVAGESGELLAHRDHRSSLVAVGDVLGAVKHPHAAALEVPVDDQFLALRFQREAQAVGTIVPGTEAILLDLFMAGATPVATHAVESREDRGRHGRLPRFVAFEQQGEGRLSCLEANATVQLPESTDVESLEAHFLLLVAGIETTPPQRIETVE